MVAALEAVGAAPELGRACDDIRPGYRRHNVGAHVLFYRVMGDVADVVRILHQRRDFRRHLPKA
ncbi:MAG: type II toxin-antitoxin system RelE/ParE family toxin [Hyphomonadaceae bacterium]|nr:type II toxin-antitoxin system RelE/ParE family toxin [Hyphomonadaceae bacterium]